MSTLLEKAKTCAGTKTSGVPEEELELALAFLRGEIESPTPVAEAVGIHRGNVNAWVLIRLRRALAKGLIRVEKENDMSRERIGNIDIRGHRQGL